MSNIKWRNCGKIRSTKHREILIRKNYYEKAEIYRAHLFQEDDGEICMMYVAMVFVSIGLGYGKIGNYSMIPQTIIIRGESMDCYDYIKDKDL
jgi:hypothetical protein